jgi:Protein of unknown function (DUF3237)
LCTVELEAGETLVVGPTSAGERVIGQVATSRWTGERLRGSLRGSSSDWAVVGPEGTGRLDVRLTLETDDGALIYIAYEGRVDLSSGLEDLVFYIAPTFETSHPDYAWLNKIQAVGKGRAEGNRTRFEIFELR